jgi:hypothetical protein
MGAPTANPTARLSNRQQDILRRLLADAQHIEATKPVDAFNPHCTAVKDLRGPGPKSAADSAAFSCSIRRLGERRLIILCNLRHGVRRGPNVGKVNIDPADKHARADHLMLTPLGKETASRLEPAKPHASDLAANAMTDARDHDVAKAPTAPSSNNPHPSVKACDICYWPPPGDPDGPRCKSIADAKARGAPWAT